MNKKLRSVATIIYKTLLASLVVGSNLALSQNTPKNCTNDAPCNTFQSRGLINCNCDINSIIIRYIDIRYINDRARLSFAKPSLHILNIRGIKYSEAVPLSWNNKPTGILEVKTEDPALAKALARGYKVERREVAKNNIVITFAFK